MIRTLSRGRRASRLGLVAASAFILTAGLVSVATPAMAQSGSANPYAPDYQHSYRHGAVPTRDAQVKMNSYAAAHPSVIPADSTANLRYGGGVDGIGVTTGHEKVYLVFWGTQWGTQ